MGPPLAKRFATAMGIEPARTVVEADLATTDTAKAHVVFIGLPESDPPIDGSGGQLALGNTFFNLDGQRFDRATDTLFSVIRRPGDSGTVIALLHPLSPTAADDVIYKIPHYGRYSYLAFRDGQNRAKGTWTVKQSPMRVAVEPETSR